MWPSYRVVKVVEVNYMYIQYTHTHIYIYAKCSIYQGDALFPLLFCIGLNPLSQIRVVTYLLCMLHGKWTRYRLTNGEKMERKGFIVKTMGCHSAWRGVLYGGKEREGGQDWRSSELFNMKILYVDLLYNYFFFQHWMIILYTCDRQTGKLAGRQAGRQAGGKLANSHHRRSQSSHTCVSCLSPVKDAEALSVSFPSHVRIDWEERMYSRCRPERGDLCWDLFERNIYELIFVFYRKRCL